MSVDLNDLAEDVIAWRRKRWPIPGGTPEMLKDAAKVAEEAGEVVGAVVKHLEGRNMTVDVVRRWHREHKAELRKQMEGE